MNSMLYPHQVEALDRLRSSIRAGRNRPILKGPCGFGKTLVAATMADGAIKKGKRVAFVVPFLSLVDQTVAKFRKEDIESIGVVQADHPLFDPLASIQICSEQTLASRQARDGYPDVDLVVIDEAHRNSEFLRDWIAHPDWQNIPFVGLSATPWTKGLGNVFNDLVQVISTAELIEKGFLSPFKVYAPSEPDLTGVKTVAGDFQKKGLREASDTPELVADIVSTWKRLGTGDRTLAFAVDRAHAKHLQQEFEAAGIPCGYCDAYTDFRDREVLGRKFDACDLPVVVNVGTLTTGVDWDVRCLILGRPTKSIILHEQIIGRAIRSAPGKEYAVILDHAGNHNRLGFVTDIQRDELCDGTRKQSEQRDKSAPLPKKCPKCSFVRPAKINECPSCGFVAKVQPGVDVIDGELVEFDGRKQKAGKPKSRQFTMEDKQRWYSGLIQICLDRGYKPGWAAQKYRAKFGVWPSRLDELPAVPPLEVVSWVKSQQIAYAKRRRDEDVAA